MRETHCELGAHVALLCGLSVPHCALDSVHRRAGATVECAGEVEQCARVALRGGLFEPLNAHRLVHLDTAALVVDDARNVVLAIGEFSEQ